MTKNTTRPLWWIPAFLMGCTLALGAIPAGCQFAPATEPQTEHPRWVCQNEPVPLEFPDTSSEPTDQPDAATPPEPPRPEPTANNDTPPDTTPPPPEQTTQSPIEQCLQLPSGPKTIKCLEPHIHTEVSTRSAKDVVCMLQRLVKEGKIDDCHLLAHIVGEAQLKKSQGDVGKAIGSCPDGCIQGCIHGVIESSFGSLQRDNIDASKLLATCDNLKHNDVSYRQCIHGLGHGLLSHGIFSIQEAVALCQSHQDAYFQFNCLFAGVVGGLFCKPRSLF